MQQSPAGRPFEQHIVTGVGIERRVQIDQVNRRLAYLPAKNRQVVAAIQMFAHGQVVSPGARGPQHVGGMVTETLTGAPLRLNTVKFLEPAPTTP